MLVPRAYHYATSRPDLLSDEKKERKHESTRPQLRVVQKAEDGAKYSKKPLRMMSAPPATPSQPVVIPTRSQGPRPLRRTETKRAGRSVSDKTEKHNPNALPPSMAALLAVTSISNPRGLAARRNALNRRSNASLQSLESVCADEGRQSLSSSSPRSWGILQTPPDEMEAYMSSVGSESTIARVSSLRSISSESTPSLDGDLDTPQSSSCPHTPSGRFVRRKRQDRLLSFSPGEDCGLDHPLSPEIPVDDAERQGQAPASNAEILSPNASVPPTPSRSTFKSNLTASLRALKSAARSLATTTTFSSQALSPATFLPPSILSNSIPYTQERRPSLPPSTLPDPALRRYLNPIRASDLHFHNNAQASTRITASIQLQPYSLPMPPSKHATSPPIFSPSARTHVIEPTATPELGPRQREPRENSDFLRVIVLEMCMRKAGKLSDDGMGRARIWLPPRECSKREEGVEIGVPKRWRAMELDA